MNFKKIHYFSGITISVFLMLHLTNHVAALWGVRAHIQIMELLRCLYANTIIEPLLFLAGLIQIISGVKLFLLNRKKTATRFEALKIWSGLYLAFFLCFHISAVLVGKNILNLDTNFYFGAAGLNTFPFVLFFGPYYTLAIVSFFGHVAGIHALKMRRDILGFDAKEQAWVILIFGVLLSFLIIFGLTAGFQGVHIPDEFLFSF